MTSNADYDPGAYPPFAVTADAVVFTRRDGRLCVLLIERGTQPHRGLWALPGGFVDIDEDLLDAAVRELAEETGIDVADLQQLGAYGTPDRDPRMRVVSIVFWTFLDDLDEPEGGDDAARAFVVPVDDALEDTARLAFDHHRILTDAVNRVENLSA